MADLDDQPDAPDLAAAVQLDPAETLEGTAGGADPLDAGYVPPDRPYALDDDTVTGAPESLDDRLDRERPEGLSGDPDRSGRIAIADGGAALETGDAMEGVDVGIDGGAASAEEAAVHSVDGDSRVDGEPSRAADPTLDDPELGANLVRDPDSAGAVEQARADARRDVGRDDGGPLR